MPTTKTVMAHRNMVRKPVLKGRCSHCGSGVGSLRFNRLWRYGRRKRDGTIGWFVGRYCDATCRDAKRYQTT